ncbi:MAG: ExbD/TolR family protein [Hyphomonadaceae bacterium]
MAGKISLGGSRKGHGQHDVTADPNVIPFIDIMLVLLIIFMIAAPISSVDIEVEMPDARVQPSQRPPRPTWISVADTPTGVQVYVMNDAVNINDLGPKTFEAVMVNSPQIAYDEFLVKEQRIYIRADSDLAYRHVVRVMNQLQNSGFTKIGFVAEDRRR